MMLPTTIENLIARAQKSWSERAFVAKAASFAMVGVVNTLVDATVFFLAYLHLTSSLVFANVLGWMAGITSSYILNSFTTFAHETGGKLTLRGYLTFAAGGLVGVVANTTTLVAAAQFLPVWGAKACAILVSFLVNFSMSHFVVFRRRPPAPKA